MGVFQALDDAMRATPKVRSQGGGPGKDVLGARAQFKVLRPPMVDRKPFSSDDSTESTGRAISVSLGEEPITASH